MERRFCVRLDELLTDAEVPPGLLRGALPRLEAFLEPFVASLRSPQQRTNAHHYVQGLLSDLDRKDAESIAYLHDRDRQGLQKFLGQADWDCRPLFTELARQVGTTLGEPDGILALDPSSFPKKGTESVGVARQWCGRLGKVENCQVGVYLAYVSRQGHTLVDCRLYLPREWTRSRKRLNQAGVPRDVRFRTRHELALELLDEHGAALPHGWVTGDDEMGRCSWFRQELRQRSERYLLAVPCNTLVRDLAAPEPPYAGRGRRPQIPLVRVERWAAALPEGRWQEVEVRAGEKGPLVVEGAWTVVQARTEGKVAEEGEVLVVFRERQSDGSYKHDYLLCNELVAQPVATLARVHKGQHRVEECLKQAKSEAGLGDYQVRTWEGWHHHQCLSMLATWFLTEETRRGKNTDSGVDSTAGTLAAGGDAERGVGVLAAGASATDDAALAATQRGGPLLPLETPQPLATALL
jgi:SRSO17 transposase